ncbi:MAG TPA: hypothetical protein VF483_09860 [Gemmatimonadaceae bacterium]
MKYAVIVVAVACAACAKPAEQEQIVNVRPMAVAPLKAGDCVEARRRAAAEPDLEVDRLPTIVSGPRPFVPTPASVQADIDKKGMSFKADVVIDTLGKAIVSSLKVSETSNEWFPRNLKALLPRMTFSPAMLAGCKVERVYKFNASAKAKGK